MQKLTEGTMQLSVISLLQMPNGINNVYKFKIESITV